MALTLYVPCIRCTSGNLLPSGEYIDVVTMENLEIKQAQLYSCNKCDVKIPMV